MTGDLGLCRVAIDGCFSHRTVSNSFTFSSTAIAPCCFKQRDKLRHDVDYC